MAAKKAKRRTKESPDARDLLVLELQPLGALPAHWRRPRSRTAPRRRWNAR